MTVLRADLVSACGEEPGWFCERAWNLTENEAVARAVDWAVGPPVRSLLIILFGFIVNLIARRGIDRTVGKAVTPGELAVASLTKLGFKAPGGLSSPIRDVRLEGRTRTISIVAKSTVSVLIWCVVTLLVLGEFGVNLAPLIAGAGIAGVALGFGAQSLVKDCLSGLFMLSEDQFGVGDIVDVGEASGVVEAITLRVTRLRSVDGTVWHVPNGVITRVGNKSQHWSMALLDIDVAYGTDLDHASAVLLAAAQATVAQDQFRSDVLDDPEVMGVEHFGADGITLRLRVKTNPGQQWALMRALRAAIKRAFDEEGIDIPFPQRTVWMKMDSTPDPGA